MSPTGHPLLDILIGCAIGTLTGLIPGLHVNTIAAASLLLPGQWAPTLLAAGTTHTVVNIIPATQFGGGDDADAGLAIPARQLALDGRLLETIRTSITASVFAGLAAWGIGAWLPWDVSMQFIAAWRIPILALFLLSTIGPLLKNRRAIATLLLAGALGYAARYPFSGPAGNQAMLPLLTGLFALPILLRTNTAGHVAPGPNRLQWRHVRTGLLDAAPLATLTAMLPGITSGVASRMTKHRGLMAHVSKISALNTMHAIFALHIVQATGIARTGLAAHAQPILWAAVPLGLAFGAIATQGLAKARLPSLRWPVLAILAGLTMWLTGPMGLVLWAGCGALGLWNKESPILLTAALWFPLLQA